MANVGKSMRTLRKLQNMTQNELAEKLYISRQTISNYEIGKSYPDIDSLIKITEVLDTDVNSLIYGIPTAPERRREFWKLVLVATITLLVGGVSFFLLQVSQEWSKQYFDVKPSILIRVVMLPLYNISLGWGVMQAMSLIFGIKPFKNHIIIHRIVIGILILYFLLILPYGIQMVDSLIQFHVLISKNTEFGFEYTYGFFPKLDSIVWEIIYFVCKKNAIFIVPGAVLWATRKE